MAYLIINALALIVMAILIVFALVTAFIIAGHSGHPEAETIVAIAIGVAVVYAIVIGKSFITSKFSRTTLKDLSYSISSGQHLLLDCRVQLLPRVERGRSPEHRNAEQGLKSRLSIIDNRLQRNGVL